MISGELWLLFNAVTKDIGHCIVFASDQLVTHVTGIQRDSKLCCYVCFLPVSRASFLSFPQVCLTMNIIYDGMPVAYRITLIFTTLPLPFLCVFPCSVCTRENLNHTRT